MREGVILLTLVIQAVIQTALYLGTNKLIHPIIKRPIVGLSACHKMFDMSRQEMVNTLVSIALLAYNIAITLFVLKITNTGALAGITNLGGSVIVGMIMAAQYSKMGKYYIEVKEKESVLSKVKKMLKKKGDQ